MQVCSTAGIADPPPTKVLDLPIGVAESRIKRQLAMAEAAAVDARGSKDIQLQVSLNPKPLTLNPKPKTLNPKPYTLNATP